MKPAKFNPLHSCLLFSVLFCACQKEGVQVSENKDAQLRTAVAQAIAPNDVVETKPAVLKAYNVKINANTPGYYMGLPARYDSTTKRYPLIFNLAGMSELGTGGTTLSKVLAEGIPKLYSLKTFPPNFVYGGKNYSFMLFAPQFTKWPTVAEVKAALDYVKTRFRIDTTRIYVTGYSMGGANAWEYAGKYAEKAAALLPMAGPYLLSNTEAQYIAVKKLPVWGFHNDFDNYVPSYTTKDNVNLINSFNPLIKAKMTIRPTGSHNVWDIVVPASYIPPGSTTNIYLWMLQYHR